MSFFAELKRRNVYKVGFAYVIVAWVIAQVIAVVNAPLNLPDWFDTVVILLLAIGFPIALLFAWAFELTPEGIKPTREVTPGESITQDTGRKLNVLITGLLIGAVIGAGAFWILKHEDYPIETPGPQETSTDIPANNGAQQLSLEDSLAKIEQDMEIGNWEAAYSLAREIETQAPDNPRLARMWPGFSSPYAITSTPTGARVLRRAYAATGDWEELGTTPIDDTRLPKGLSVLRFELNGYEPVIRDAFTFVYGGEIVRQSITPLPPVTLDTLSSLPEGMVRVPGWNAIIGDETVTLRDFFIDKEEVTNREYKAFVDAGGYRRPEFWQQPVIRDGKQLDFEEAMTLFVDRTGRPGPSTWEVGDFPEGQADYPVGGVSWYEAAAYAVFKKKELPTRYHWQRAFAPGLMNELAYMLPASNLDAKAVLPANQSRGMTWTGAFDMAGNVREWVMNAEEDRRYILGGGWNDPFYVGMDMGYAQPPLDRSPTNGFRLMSTRDDAAAKKIVLQEIKPVEVRNVMDEKPVSDETFAAYQGIFKYDHTPLNASIDTTVSTPIWKRERITMDAAYGNEQLVLYLFLPLNSTPPYQTVVVWPGLSFFLGSIDDYGIEDFTLKDGRALAFPVYKGIFERGDRSPPPYVSTVAWRDLTVENVNDLRRSIDYLETRADIDPGKFSYFGTSWGAGMAPMALAVEPRIKTAVLVVGGIYYHGIEQTKGWPLPEVDPVVYLPRIHIPVLMLNGEYDSIVNIETSAKPYYELLGVQEPDKKHVIAPGGHFVPKNILIRETLDWLDKYLGPVN